MILTKGQASGTLVLLVHPIPKSVIKHFVIAQRAWSLPACTGSWQGTHWTRCAQGWDGERARRCGDGRVGPRRGAGSVALARAVSDLPSQARSACTDQHGLAPAILSAQIQVHLLWLPSDAPHFTRQGLSPITPVLMLLGKVWRKLGHIAGPCQSSRKDILSHRGAAQ